MERCFFCGGTPEYKIITARFERDGELVLIENVPAWVCRECGEAYYESTVALAIDELLANPPPTEKTVTVPIYTLTTA